MDEKLMISANDLLKNTPLGGNIDPDKFRFSIQDAQITTLEELLGQELYEKIRDDFPSYEEPYTELYARIKPFLIHQAAVEYLKTNAFAIGNQGMFRPTPANGSAVDASDVSYVVRNQQIKADIYRGRLEKFLCLNHSDYPEYRYASDNIINPNHGDNSEAWDYN